MSRRFALKIAAILGGTLLQWYVQLPPSWPIAPWRLEISPIIGGLSAVLPGVLVGFVVGRSGLLLGALVGLLGRLALTVPLILSSNPDASIFAILPHPVLSALGFAIFAAAGGGTGQLLRSNYRWSGHET
jgi:hypothetical protein